MLYHPRLMHPSRSDAPNPTAVSSTAPAPTVLSALSTATVQIPNLGSSLPTDPSSLLNLRCVHPGLQIPVHDLVDNTTPLFPKSLLLVSRNGLVETSSHNWSSFFSGSLDYVEERNTDGVFPRGTYVSSPLVCSPRKKNNSVRPLFRKLNVQRAHDIIFECPARARSLQHHTGPRKTFPSPQAYSCSEHLCER